MGEEVIVFNRRKGEAVRTPMPGSTHMYAKNDGAMWFKDEWGIETPVAPDGIYTRQQMVLPDAGAATRSLIGLLSTTITATQAPTSTDDATGPWHTHTTATTLNAAGGLISSFAQFRAGWYPRLRWLIKTGPSLAGYRLMMGFFSASPDAAPTNISGAYFRYSTNLDGTAFWRTCTANGGAPTVAITTVPVTVSTVYMLGIDFVPPDPFVRGATPASIKFTIASGTNQTEAVVANHTATLPAANTALGWGFRVVNIAAGAAKAASFSRLGFVTT